MAEWIRPQTSIPEVPGSNPSTAVVPLGKVLYLHCLVPRKGLTVLACLLDYIKQLAFLELENSIKALLALSQTI